MAEMNDKNRSRGMSRDMSPEAVSKRLRIVSNLRNLCLKLGRAETVKREEHGGKQAEPEK